MMMNDPHRDLGAPSLRYWVHLVAPGWNVIGGGEPALPGVSIGHNDFGRGDSPFSAPTAKISMSTTPTRQIHRSTNTRAPGSR